MYHPTSNCGSYLRLLACTAAVLLAPVFAWATVMINVDHVEVAPTGTDLTVYVDVYLVDLDNTDERLNSYNLVVRGPANTPDGVRFVSPPRRPSAGHPYVFRDVFFGDPQDMQSDHSMMFIDGFPQGPIRGVDVSEAYSGMVAIPVRVPATARPDNYPIVIDPNLTDLYSSGLRIEWTIGPPGGVTLVPEPSAFAAATLAILPLLGRRRRSRMCMAGGTHPIH